MSIRLYTTSRRSFILLLEFGDFSFNAAKLVKGCQEAIQHERCE